MVSAAHGAAPQCTDNERAYTNKRGRVARRSKTNSITARSCQPFDWGGGLQQHAQGLVDPSWASATFILCVPTLLLLAAYNQPTPYHR